MPDVQEDRLDRAWRLRHGAPGGVRSRRLRSRALYRLRLGDRHRTDCDSAVPGGGHPVVLRERSEVPGAVPVLKATTKTRKHEGRTNDARRGRPAKQAADQMK